VREKREKSEARGSGAPGKSIKKEFSPRTNRAGARCRGLPSPRRGPPVPAQSARATATATHARAHRARPRRPALSPRTGMATRVGARAPSAVVGFARCAALGAGAEWNHATRPRGRPPGPAARRGIMPPEVRVRVRLPCRWKKGARRRVWCACCLAVCVGRGLAGLAVQA